MTRLLPPLIVVIALSGCASVSDTPQQAYVSEKGRIWDARVPFWTLHRVEVDSRYEQWLSQRTETR